MNPAKLTLVALLATAPAAFGQSITRVDVDHQVVSRSADFTPGVMHQATGWVEVLVSSNVGVSQNFPGVETDVEFHGVTTRSLSMGAIALVGAGTYFEGVEVWTSAAAGGSWMWGWCNDCGGVDFTLSPMTPLGQAYTLAGVAPSTEPFGGQQTDIEFAGGGGVDAIMGHNILVQAEDVIGSPLDMLATSLSLDIEVDMTVTATRTLFASPLASYCTSQANGLGVHGRLEAYGSDEAGSLWLTLRTRDVPEGSAGILFMGTDIVVVPGGTTTLCVGGNLQRVGGVQVVNGGHADFEVSLASFLPGDTARFQCFHRDPVVGVAATDAFALTVQ